MVRVRVKISLVLGLGLGYGEYFSGGFFPRTLLDKLRIENLIFVVDDFKFTYILLTLHICLHYFHNGGSGTFVTEKKI